MKKLILRFSFFSFILFCSSNLLAQEKIDATFEASDGKIFIYYEIKGDPEKEFNVEVTLRRTSVPSFKLTPSEMTGDVGEGKFAGRQRTIVWRLKPEEEAILDGEDFYFEVIAEAIEEGGGGGVPWYVWVGGAAVGGGVAALLLLKKDDGGGGGTTSTNLPAPPGRP
jgi:hypothetical protein